MDAPTCAHGAMSLGRSGNWWVCRPTTGTQCKAVKNIPDVGNLQSPVTLPQPATVPVTVYVARGEGQPDLNTAEGRIAAHIASLLNGTYRPVCKCVPCQSAGPCVWG